MDDDLAVLPATELLLGYAAKRISPVEATRAALDRIRRLDSTVTAFCLVDEEGALAAARASESRWMASTPRGLVDGVPTTIKDLLLAKGWPTRRASRVTNRDQPWAEDAPAVARLREQGAVFLGKTTTSEFGWKPVTDSPLVGITRNPWDRSRNPGGSSGGAAVAAALGMGALHIGSDGAGSIRIPASFCGVFGLKPTYGRVPAYPPSPNSALAHVGPITRTVADAALMLTAMTGHDARDSYALPQEPRDWRIGPEAGVAGLRIAFAPTLDRAAVDPPVARLVDAAVRRMAQLGAIVDEAEPPLTGAEESLLRMYRAAMIVLVRGFSADERALLDPGLRRFAEDGPEVGLIGYFEALKAREALSAELNRFFERYDLLVLPTLPITAFGAGAIVPDGSGHTAWHQWTPFCGPFNLTRTPAASIPCGFADGLPVGLQVVGPRFREDLVLRACRAYESVAPICLPGAAAVRA